MRIDPQGLAESFRRRASRGPERPALSFEGRTWTYAELQQRIERLAAVLAAGGVQRGDRVGLLAFNHPAHLVGLYAAAHLGAIFVPLNIRLAPPELQRIIEDAGVQVLLADDTHAAVVDGLRASLSCRRYIRVGEAAPGWEGFDALLEEAPPPPAMTPAGQDDVVLLIYTSGTTGKPKGAMLTHGNFWANNVNWILANDFTSADVTLVNAPLFHVGGLCVVLSPTFLVGGHIVLHRAFDAQEFIRAVGHYRVSVSFGVPAMMLFVSQHQEFQHADLSSLRLIVAGGAPVPEPLLHVYARRGIPVSQCYGMTEATSGATFLETHRALSKLGSCGRAGMLTDVCLRDFDGRPVTTPGVRGEIWVRGANVFKGYWNNPVATAQAFDADGWYRSGDVAYCDADGFYFICDRVKDMVISGGENVYPGEVESVLYEHPAIAEVAVIGAPDERWGERVVAVASLKPGAALSLEELQAFAAARLARYKLPRELRIVDVMPRNPQGKVQKTELRKLYAG